MEIAITKMSQNGQVVIPAEIRKEAGIKPKTKFLVMNEDGTVILKPIKILREDLEFIKKIKKSEEQIKRGEFVKADSEMSAEEIDKLLTS